MAAQPSVETFLPLLLATVLLVLVGLVTGRSGQTARYPTYWWSPRRRRASGGLAFAPELLHAGALFHRIGLNQEQRSSGRRFEIADAEEARARRTPPRRSPHTPIRRSHG
ncbi:hypothetical protein OIU91_02620 [Streptomyces sp. NBC_01456]|uniref:hypothetical protein n=1 Tax=unclassified Streptomyces TaxID=2593676 RepID=UPI002E381B3E|nr:MULTISPECIES: hypothetical protein [unclassified Streptomyces]